MNTIALVLTIQFSDAEAVWFKHTPESMYFVKDAPFS